MSFLYNVFDIAGAVIAVMRDSVFELMSCDVSIRSVASRCRYFRDVDLSALHRKRSPAFHVVISYVDYSHVTPRKQENQHELKYVKWCNISK